MIRGIPEVRRTLLGMSAAFVVGCYAATGTTHLYQELRISLDKAEAPAQILKVETFDRDNGDKSWTVDLINYSFMNPEGFLFSGVNEANSSQTKALVGSPDQNGRYQNAVVEYLPRDPSKNRLKGWGYDGYGPPGGIGWLVLRLLMSVALVFGGLALAYRLLANKGPRAMGPQPD